MGGSGGRWQLIENLLQESFIFGSIDKLLVMDMAMRTFFRPICTYFKCRLVDYSSLDLSSADWSIVIGAD